MEKEDEFLHSFFNNVSQVSYDKAIESIEKEKDQHKSISTSPWITFLNFLQQLALTEKSYMDIGFLQNKNKGFFRLKKDVSLSFHFHGFLRKDNSLKAVYETMKLDVRKLEDNFKTNNKRVQNYCQNIFQFLCARVNLIELYERIHQMSGKNFRYIEVLNHADSIIEKNALFFSDISMTSTRAVFNLECEILQQLFRALTELQRLQFLPSLALIHGAHIRLTAWESRVQNKESWKLGFLKNNPVPALLQWLQKLKGIVVSKFSLYFHNTLAQQTTPNDMRTICTKLQHDHYQKMVNFQKKHDAAYVILLSDNQVDGDTTDYDSFPIIVSYPPKSPPQLETIMKMISDTSSELLLIDKIIYKFSNQDQYTYVITTVEPNIYLVIIFESKKTEKDVFIENFITEMCTNLRCTKVFLSLRAGLSTLN